MPATVTALGVVTGHGLGLGPLLAAVRAGSSAIKKISRFSTEGLCSDLGAEAPSDEALVDAARTLGQAPAADRATRLLLAAAAEAFAGHRFTPSARRGVVVGTTKGALELQQARWAKGSPALEDALCAPALALARASASSGPVRSVGAACASSTAALGEALALIEDGTCDEVLVGGTEALHSFVYAGFHALKALSPAPAAPFDAQRSGLSLGEGAAVLWLVKPGYGRGPELGQLLGYGAASDGHDQTAPDPQARGLLLACRQALSRAGVSAREVGRYHGHGTATLYNDQMESAACAALFGPMGIPVCATKGSLGHTLGAAGALDAVCCLLTLGKLLPPVAHLNRVDPKLEVDAVVKVGRPSDSPRALLATAGFGGINAALVLQAGSGR